MSYTSTHNGGATRKQSLLEFQHIGQEWIRMVLDGWMAFKASREGDEKHHGRPIFFRRSIFHPKIKPRGVAVFRQGAVVKNPSPTQG